MSEPRIIADWDTRFLLLAHHYAQWSKDPSHQFGAVLVRGTDQFSQGYNGFPRGVYEKPEDGTRYWPPPGPECFVLPENRQKALNGEFEGTTAVLVPPEEILARWDRPLKYELVVHAEQNAILNAARNGVSCLRSTMYVTGHPCAGCSKCIIQAGIVKVVYFNPDTDYLERWADSIKLSSMMFAEAGVQLVQLPNPL